MQAPDVVFLGSSIIAGHPDNWSFIEHLEPRRNETSRTAVDSTLSDQFADLTGLVTHNMGIGGQGAREALERFHEDVVELKPRMVVFEGASNDIHHWSDPTTIDSVIIASALAAADSARRHGIIFAYTLVPPRELWVTRGDVLKLEYMDMVNRRLVEELRSHAYSDSILIIDLSYTHGLEANVEKSCGGHAWGNRWNCVDAYYRDGAHMSGVGYRRWALQICRAMNAAIEVAGK
jgi:lysophospholipase L1-like esterase